VHLIKFCSLSRMLQL